MKIDLSKIDLDSFMVHQHIIGGEACYLVQPKFAGAKWNRENRIFRSSLWNDLGELVSAGFPKFTNWGENPENFPVPSSLKNTTITEKVDGSLLIVSKYKGQYILRTRGTVDGTVLKNGHELETFKKTILPKIEIVSGENLYTWNCSMLFEWTSPLQKIILHYGDDPQWHLVGGVFHNDYSLMPQSWMNQIAKNCDLNRPITYTFPTVDDLIKGIEDWKGKEGVCVYSKDGQAIHKVKGAWYLALHRMKEEFGSIDRLIDVWFTWGCPDYKTTEERIISQFDWELFTTVRGDISKICEGWKEVLKIESGFQAFIDKNLKHLPSRKEQAKVVIDAYGITNRASFLFKLLDGKELALDDRKKLLYQVLKK